MSPIPRTRRLRVWTAALLTALALGGMSAATPVAAAPALTLPSPLRFTSYLDLECFKTSTYVPPTTSFTTRHLNPVLANLPTETVTLGAREQLCVPVAKNNVIPPDDVLPFIKYVDLSCYRITGINVNTPLQLSHLNPVLAGLPARWVTITTPQQLCVPVIKNGMAPPADVKQLVAFIDLKCYLEQPQASLNKTLALSHLNPVLANLPQHTASVTLNRQLCVPVQKGTQAIPAAVLNIVRWIDLEKFDIVTPALTTPVTLTINHLNPLLSGLPTETVTLQSANQLLIPVAKNGQIPPA